LTPDERRDLIAFLESLTDREALRDPRWSDPVDTTDARHVRRFEAMLHRLLAGIVVFTVPGGLLAQDPRLEIQVIGEHRLVSSSRSSRTRSFRLKT
jgi:hypothetical protein